MAAESCFVNPEFGQVRAFAGQCLLNERFKKALNSGSSVHPIGLISGDAP